MININNFYSIFKFDFTIKNLMAFLLGALIASIMIGLFYLYAVVKSFKRKARIIKIGEERVDQEDIEKIMIKVKKKFKKDKNKVFMSYLYEIINEISSLFFPKSEKPFLELTVDEAIDISKYITNRLDEIFEIRLLNLLRGMTLKQIFEINKIKKRVEETSVVKVMKTNYFKRIYLLIISILNILNPLYWFKKGVVDNVTKIISNKIMLELMDVTAEETYKIFSNKVINLEREESDYDLLFSEIEKEVEKYKGV